MNTEHKSNNSFQSIVRILLPSNFFNFVFLVVGVGTLASLPRAIAVQVRTTPTVFQGFMSRTKETLSTMVYNAMKRGVDAVASAILLLAFAPLMAVIAILVKLDSSGPVFFKQERVGSQPRLRNGRVVWERVTFECYKFRSMHQNSDSARHKAFFEAFVKNDEQAMRELAGDDDDASLKFKMKKDPRITRVGAFLRKTSLDELPQLWNILRGDMSLVGPRPAIPYEVEMYAPEFLERLNAKQGLTGLWQVKGRSAMSFEDTMELDVWYARNKNFWLDIKILLETPLAVLAGKGAN